MNNHSGFVFWAAGNQWILIFAVMWLMVSLPVVLTPRRKR